MDMSQLSDEELEKLASSPDPGTMDMSSMSDEELERLANPPGELESLGRGALQGATMGFADEISGGIESALTDKTYEQARDESRRNFKQASDSNPGMYTTGQIGGGLATALIPGLGAANGLRGAVGAGAAIGAATGLGNSEASDTQGKAVDTLTGLGIGAGGGALGYGVAKGAQKGLNFVTQKAAPAIEKMLPIGKKQNAAEIEAAAKALGIKATPGMTNASERVQGLESSLHQAPTIGGWLTRRGTEPVGKGMRRATDDLISDAATVSPYESGETVKKILSKEIEGKFKPSTDTFNELARYTKDIPTNERSIKAVSRNILNIPEVDTLDLPFAKQVIKRLEKEPSVDGIKQLRTMVGKKAKTTPDAAEASAYWQMYAKLGQLEENTLKRGVISSARTKGEGETIAKGMLSQLKSAKKGYSEQMSKLEDFSQAARLGKVNGPGAFTDKIDSIPSERLQEKLLPLEDVRLSKELQSQFPEAFGGLRKARIRDLSENVIQDGKSVPGKFLQNTRDLNPEAQSMLFGDKSPLLNNLRTVNQALPDQVGPSGTSQALDFKEMLNPVTQGRDLLRYGAYKAASSETLNKAGAFLRSKPKFANMAEQNPKAFQAAVYQFADRINPEGGAYKAAGFDPSQPVDEEQAKQSFLEGN